MIEIDLIREGNRVYQQVLRAKAMGLSATLTLEEWVDRIQQFEGLCAYCLEAPFTSLDHLMPPSTGGNTIVSNCVPVCLLCNSRKNDRVLCDTSADVSFEAKLEQVRYVLKNNLRIAKPKSDEQKEEEIKITFRLDEEMHAALREVARSHNRSLNGELLTAVADHLKRSQKEQRKP